MVVPLKKKLYKWNTNNLGPGGGRVELSWGLGKGYICVVVDKEEEAQAMFLNDVWMIVGGLGHVNPWYEAFDLEFDSQHKYPLWM